MGAITVRSSAQKIVFDPDTSQPYVHETGTPGPQGPTGQRGWPSSTPTPPYVLATEASLWSSGINTRLSALDSIGGAGWGTLTLTLPFEAYEASGATWAVPSYKLIKPKLVALRGLMKKKASYSASVPSYTTIATLPVGFRPQMRQSFIVMADGLTALNQSARVDVRPDGKIVYVKGGLSFYFSLFLTFFID